MKFIKSIKNLFPYLILVGIYFFFVNIEAHKDRAKTSHDNKLINNKKENIEYKQVFNETNQRIIIPVIPYNQ